MSTTPAPEGRSEELDQAITELRELAIRYGQKAATTGFSADEHLVAWVGLGNAQRKIVAIANGTAYEPEMMPEPGDGALLQLFFG